MVTRLGPEDLTRLGASLYEDLFAVDPDVYVTSSYALGQRIADDLKARGHLYATLLPFGHSARTTLACLCRLSVASLTLSPLKDAPNAQEAPH